MFVQVLLPLCSGPYLAQRKDFRDTLILRASQHRHKIPSGKSELQNVILMSPWLPCWFLYLIDTFVKLIDLLGCLCLYVCVMQELHELFWFGLVATAQHKIGGLDFAYS
jgi:hypothetical protein